jgi:hypothetical protein
MSSVILHWNILSPDKEKDMICGTVISEDISFIMKLK